MAVTYYDNVNGVDLKYQTIKDINYYVFDDEEDFVSFFKNSGKIPPTLIPDWRDAKKGEWTIADDEGIVQILYKSKLVHPNDYSYTEKGKNWSEKGWCRTIVGSFVCKKKYLMDTNFDEHRSRYQFSKSGLTLKESINSREKATKKEILFALLISQGIRSQEDIISKYMEVFKCNSAVRAKNNAFLLLGQERIMKIVTEEVKNKAAEIGITPEFVLKGVKGLAENAGREDVRLSSLIKCGEYIEMEKEVGSNNNQNLITGFGSVIERQIGNSGITSLIEDSAVPVEVNSKQILLSTDVASSRGETKNDNNKEEKVSRNVEHENCADKDIRGCLKEAGYSV